MTAKFHSCPPYVTFADNPIKFTDPTGMAPESIHLDEKENVLRNYNDGNNNVYVHKAGTTVMDIYKRYVASMAASKSKVVSAGGAGIGELGKTLNVNGIYTNLLTSNIKEASEIYNPWTFKGNILMVVYSYILKNLLPL